MLVNLKSQLRPLKEALEELLVERGTNVESPETLTIYDIDADEIAIGTPETNVGFGLSKLLFNGTWIWKIDINRSWSTEHVSYCAQDDYEMDDLFRYCLWAESDSDALRERYSTSVLEAMNESITELVEQIVAKNPTLIRKKMPVRKVTVTHQSSKLEWYAAVSPTQFIAVNRP